MNRLNNINIYVVAIVFAVLINIISWNFPFFWDTLLTSTITQYFYNNGFQNFIVPPQLDAGHPPLFYMYVTGFYHIFGKNLIAAHFAMLPFTIIGIVSFILLLKYFAYSKKMQFLGVALYFSIPAVLTQNTLVSYDVVLLSVYLLALVAIFKNNYILFLLCCIVLVDVSLRGLFCIAALSVSVFFIKNKNYKTWFIWNLYMFPSVVFIAAWYYYHYLHTGWFFATNAAGWSEQRGVVSGIGLFKNCISIIRCFIDVGIVVLSFICLIYFIKVKKNNHILMLLLIPFIVFSIAFLPFSNPINHRYFLIVYVLMLLPVLQFLSTKKNIYSIFIIVLLILGNFQIYSVPISNAWDCTMKYTSYLSAKDDFDNLNARGFHINKSKVGTVFPMNVSLQQSNLYNDTIRLINIHDKSIDTIPYILFSNVGNDFSDEQINQLKNWKIIAQFTRKQVYLILYGNPAVYKK